MTHDLLGRVLGPRPGPFALVYRPDTTGPDRLDVLLGSVSEVGALADIPLDTTTPAGDGPHQDVLALIPYRQIAERGFAARDDGTPLLAMTVEAQAVVDLDEVRLRVPDAPVRLGA
ncbi:phenazine-specific anthranilate synthase component I, partial [Kitasatospora sp. NPDC056783]